MTIEIEEDTGAKSTFREADIDIPDGLSILPNGVDEVDSERVLILPDDSDTVRKLLEEAGVDVTEISSEEDVSILILRSEELILPTLYAAYTFTRDNWDQIRYGLETLSGHYSRQHNQDVKMSVEQERPDGTTTRLKYSGPPEQLDELSPEIAHIVGVETEEEDERQS